MPAGTAGCSRSPAVSSGAGIAIRASTAAVVLAVAGIAAYISCWHACAVVREYGESGVIALLEPGTIDGLACASSMFSWVRSLLCLVALECPARVFATHLVGVVLAVVTAQKAGRAGLQQMQHPAWRRREVDQGSASANRNDVQFAVVATPENPW